jgi:hypothetical protein
MSKAIVNISYRFSAKTDPSQKDSPWAGAEVSYGIEQDAPGELDLTKAAEQLFTDAKMQVFAQLGVEFTQDENGAIQPVVPVADVPTYAPRKPAKERPDYSGLPRLTVNGVEYIDFREAKKPVEDGGLGLVKPRFPDFKTVDLKEGFYLTLPDGKTKSEFAEMLENVGALA